MKSFVFFSLFSLIINTFAYSASLSLLRLCTEIDGTLRPLDRLICESSAAMLESMNPSLEIPVCSEEKNGPQVLSGDKVVSAVFISCTMQTLHSCKNIASSVMTNQPGVTVNILVTSAGIADENVSQTLLELADISKEKKTPLNILPINSVSDGANITYMRDPGVFVSQGQSKTSFVGLPYHQDMIPGSMVMSEAMKWCGVEHLDTYSDLAEFDTAYKALAVEENSRRSEETQRTIAGLQAVNDYSTHNATMGGNFIALPNGTLVTGYTKISRPSPAVIEYFSKEHSILKVQLPELTVGHIDEILNIVPSDSPCGYTILMASPAESIRYLESIKESKEPFLRFFDMNMVDPMMPEKKPVQEKLREIYQKKNEYLYADEDVPQEILDMEETLLEELLIISGQHVRTPSEILNDQKIMDHMKKLDEASLNVLNEVLNELSREENSCSPEVITLPVFWDYTMPRPLIPNPVNGLALNGSYFRSKSYGLQKERGNLAGRKSYPKLDEYINKKIEKLFPKGIHQVDTAEHDEGSGNFHCATTNIYLPCKP